MSELWVVVADQSKARIFTIDDPRGALLEVCELEHPEALEREQKLTSDRPGRSFDSMGHGRHAMGSTVEPGKQETIRFAKQVADHVQAAHNKGRCDRVLLVAGPPMLSALRENLKGLSGVEMSEFEKNLGQYDATEIRKHLPERL
jgi:protein required for attachment to host cells